MAGSNTTTSNTTKSITTQSQAAANQHAQTQAQVQAVKDLLGACPEGALYGYKTGSDALGWLEEIFKTIQQDAMDEIKSYRVKRLAELGAYVAGDLSNSLHQEHGGYIKRLKDAGIKVCFAYDAEGEL
ncbi:MAG: hypothetical protein RIR18_1907 [Pseudomonadota bacterium]|jgi:hypothetical protein